MVNAREKHGAKTECCRKGMKSKAKKRLRLKLFKEKVHDEHPLLKYMYFA